MSDGNKRYLGDVLINEDNYERQKQFFRDIIESYQYKYNGNFDAATLQGKGASDFATKEQGERADNALLSPLFLGKTEITNKEDPQYILTDAILLDRDIINNINLYKNFNDDNITEALIAIADEFENKLDIDTYNDFINNEYNIFKNSLLDAFEIVEDEEGNQQALLNASLINGLRFCLITQQSYDQLSDTIKNNWRNVFIIKDPSEIPPDYQSPLIPELTEGYQFRINEGYLEFTNGLSDEWKQICSLDNLLIGAGLEEIILEYLTSDSKTFILNRHNLLNSLAQISPMTIDEDWETYPFLSSSLRDSFINKITINDSDDDVSYSIEPITGFKQADIDIESILSEEITPLTQELSNQNSLLADTIDNVATLSQTIDATDLKNIAQDNEIDEINQSLTSIKNQLTTINNNIAGIGTWERRDITGLQYNDGTTTHKSFVLYNNKIRLAFARLFFGTYIGAEDINDAEGWVHINKNNYVQFNISPQPVSALGRFISMNNPLDSVKIDGNGVVMFRSSRKTATNKLVPVSVTFMYKF